MLRNRELIPPLTLHVSQDRAVRAWDFKHKRNLVIAFLDVSCSPCWRVVRMLATHAEELRECEAIALLVFPQELSSPVCDSLPDELIIGRNDGEATIRKFLGRDALSVQRFERRGIFVTDRYGELYDQWVVEGHKFPQVEEIMNSLNQIEMACEECGAPYWPSDE